MSHAYHLPRVKLELQHARLAAVTVPAREQRVLLKMPLFVGREVAAYWLHLLDLPYSRAAPPSPAQSGGQSPERRSGLVCLKRVFSPDASLITPNRLRS